MNGCELQKNIHVPYAVERLRQHAENFHELYEDVKNSALDEEYIKRLEDKFNLFPDIDYSIYGT